jgi:predicted dehydrogenase
LLKAAILGGGRIGCGYPDAPDGTPRNHLSAIMATPGIQATALVDPDDNAFKAIQERYENLDGMQFASRASQLSSQPFDVVALCGPSGSRESQLHDALGLEPGVIIIEKPLATDETVALELAAMIEAAGVTARINFLRRFDANHVQLKSSLNQTPRKAILRYGKGIHNYGTHLIDLMLDWFGPIAEVRALDCDLSMEDPTISFWCRMASGFETVAVALDNCVYDQFECDFFFQDSRIELSSGGAEMRVYIPRKGKINLDITHLDEVREQRRIHPIGGLTEMYEATVRHLRDGEELDGCYPDEAIRGLAVISAILKSAQNGGSLECTNAA